MNLADALLPGTAGVVAFVGAGGKTRALFRLARELGSLGRSLLVTTTTHMADPSLEALDHLVYRPDLEAPWTGGALPAFQPGLTMLVSRTADATGKVKGIHPSWVAPLRSVWDLIFVEADGSRRLPVKAPAPFEPALPPGVDRVVGVVGLDCLGRPMDDRTVHRPERFGELTGCAAGAPITWDHLAALVRHPEGLFKDAAGPRTILLNKADRLAALPDPAWLRSLGRHQVLVCSMEAPGCVFLCLPEVP